MNTANIRVSNNRKKYLYTDSMNANYRLYLILRNFPEKGEFNFQYEEMGDEFSKVKIFWGKLNQTGWIFIKTL